MRWKDGVNVTGQLMVQMINMTAGQWLSIELLPHPQYQQLSSVTNNVCHELSKLHNSEVNTSSHFYTRFEFDYDSLLIYNYKCFLIALGKLHEDRFENARTSATCVA